MNRTFISLLGYAVFCYLAAAAVYAAVEYAAARRAEVYLIMQRPGEPEPSPAEVSALIEEARRITREAPGD